MTIVIRQAIYLCLLCVFFLSGCNKQESCISQSSLASLKSLDIERAKNEADIAFDKRDKQFLAVNGYTTQILGVPNGEFVIKHYPFRVIDGTTDAPCDEEHATLVRRARKYSTIYNAEIWARLNQKK